MKRFTRWIFILALDASLSSASSESAEKNSLRDDLQRPIDARLLKLEHAGIEGSGLFTGKVHRVQDAQGIQALSGRLNPGDQLVLANGHWQNSRISFSGRGTEAAPILIRPDPTGGALFSGNSSVAFEGTHLIIIGLEFKNLVVTNKGTVIFRLGNGTNRPAEHCIVNRIKIENCNSPDPADWPRVRLWQMTVNGRDNTVANSTFADLKNFGQMLAAQNLPPTGLQRLHILNNRFVNRPKLDLQNGYEVIQIGWSGEKARSAGSLIQGNYFQNCDGENEIITLKASDVVVRSNTFAGCQGVLCLRETDRVLVQGNVFDGNGRPNTGAIRLTGADHVITGNTFRNLRLPSNYYYWTISMMCADGETSGDDPAGYGRVKNIFIARNRFEHNDTRIAVGTYPRPQYPLLPQNIRVKDNVFVGTTATNAFDYIAPDPTGVLPKELHQTGNQFLP